MVVTIPTDSISVVLTFLEAFEKFSVMRVSKEIQSLAMAAIRMDANYRIEISKDLSKTIFYEYNDDYFGCEFRDYMGHRKWEKNIQKLMVCWVQIQSFQPSNLNLKYNRFNDITFVGCNETIIFEILPLLRSVKDIKISFESCELQMICPQILDGFQQFCTFLFLCIFFLYFFFVFFHLFALYFPFLFFLYHLLFSTFLFFFLLFFLNSKNKALVDFFGE